MLLNSGPMTTAANNTKIVTTDDTATSEVVVLRQEVALLKHELAWFRKQLFGSKSEKRLEECPDQLGLFGKKQSPDTDTTPTQTVSYERGKAKKQRSDDCVSEHGLRFDDSVPVKTIVLPVLEAQGLSADEYEIIGNKVFHKLAQRPASYVVIRYEQPVIKIKQTQEIANAITPMAVFDKSMADVSFLAGMLVDKFTYHLPLYRQHQRLAGGGITLSRSTLANLVKRSIELLTPIADVQLKNVLLSRVLAMDETPIKAGKSKTKKGRMHQGYFWPVYGELDEVSFVYTNSRAHNHVQKIIGESFAGTLVTDGYAAYARFAVKNDAVTNAQCWTHARRPFVEAQDSEPVAVAQILEMIGALYANEAHIKVHTLQADVKHAYRLEHSKPIVEQIYAWVREQRQREDLVPKDPFSKALMYMANREVELSVFLSDPDVPIDTNHLERLIRPIPMGRRNWLFCWTELGAAQVGVIQSLISTCKLHDINAYVYLVDVMQRVQIHPNSQIEQLTPRLWKQYFADDPMGSDLDLIV
ncbi:IS66 family transposase [Granulosicoccus sp.]|nr:IS66 family transposase [Granulosicoccus sp.]MDB4224165.1 IS66 family transposase [Granulosicoccus sp.]